MKLVANYFRVCIYAAFAVVFSCLAVSCHDHDDDTADSTIDIKDINTIELASNEATGVTFNFKTNYVDEDAKATTSDAWILNFDFKEKSAVDADGYVEYTYTFDVEPNTGADNSGTITITSGDKTESVSVSQAGGYKEPVVYVAGYTQNSDGVQVATLWRNGEKQELTSETEESRAYSVYVSGTDVYVAGSEERISGSIPVLWKNGETQELPMTGMFPSGIASSVHVFNGGVYVAGQVKSVGVRMAVVWKNGEMQELSASEASANSIFVSGTDVYVAGYEEGKAVLWKNGKMQELSTVVTTFAQSVFVSDTDVYVAGYIDDNISGKTLPLLWKNGDTQVLVDDTKGAFAYSVFVSGTDVYVSGLEDDKAVLWKNGEKQELMMADAKSLAFSVFVSGTDVYVAGKEDNKAALWKNGEKQELMMADANSLAQSVFVAIE